MLRRDRGRMAGTSLASLVPTALRPHGPLALAFLRFLVVGALGLAVDMGVFLALDGRGMAPEFSRLASLGAAFFVTFALNRHFTFAPSGRNALGEALRYALGAFGAQGLSYGVFLFLVYRAPFLPRPVSLVVGAGLAAVAAFATHRLFTFAAAAPLAERRA